MRIFLIYFLVLFFLNLVKILYLYIENILYKSQLRNSQHIFRTIAFKRTYSCFDEPFKEYPKKCFTLKSKGIYINFFLIFLEM